MQIKYIAMILVGIVALIGLRASPQDAEQQVPEDRTVVQVGSVAYARGNGRQWKRLGTESKTALLYGYEEGMTLLVRETSAKAKPDIASKTQEIAESLLVAGFRYSDFAKQIDELYADTANLRIPIIDAYVWSLRKIRGATKQELEDLVVGLRRKYNN